MDTRSAIRLIEKCFPEIKVRYAKQLQTGWENFVLEVNREYIFRFPRFKETTARLKIEIQLLSKLRGYLTAPIPDYAYVRKGRGDYSSWFGGYRKLQGITVSNQTLRRESVRRIAEQISKFQAELRNAENRVKTVTIPRYSNKEWVRNERVQYRKIRRTVYSLLDPETRARSEKFWLQLFEYFDDSTFEPTLIHGDLSTENILFDAKTWKITGVLDWGYAQVSDPALEIAHLFHHNREVGEEVLKICRPSDRDFANRVQWYVRSEPYHDVMWGVTHERKMAVKLGLRNLAESLKKSEVR